MTQLFLPYDFQSIFCDLLFQCQFSIASAVFFRFVPHVGLPVVSLRFGLLSFNLVLGSLLY